jgi:CBS domain-containing protein
MQAHEIMITPVYTVRTTDTIRAVVEKFVQYRISGVLVVNEQNQIAGYISDGDIMRYIGKHENVVFFSLESITFFKGDQEDYQARTERILGLNVMNVAQKKVIKVSWDEDIENVAAILGKKQIKKVPVERDGILVGIISRGDMIRSAFKGLL